MLDLVHLLYDHGACRDQPLQPDEWAILERLARRAAWDGDCLILTGDRSRDGYAYFTAEGRRHSAHRWIFETFHSDATGLDVDHPCGTRPCILQLRRLPAWRNRGWRPPS